MTKPNTPFSTNVNTYFASQAERVLAGTEQRTAAQPSEALTQSDVPPSASAAAITTFKTEVHTQAPRRSTKSLVDEFVTKCGHIIERSAVLELTYIESKLLSEIKVLDKLVSGASFSDSAALRTALEYYTTQLSEWLAANDHMFDDTNRLRQPWYRDALKSGMQVKLSERGTPAAAAFSYVEELRNFPTPKVSDMPTPRGFK